MVEDAQTHLLPAASDALDNVARLHGLDDGEALLQLLKPTVDAAGAIFDGLSPDGQVGLSTDPDILRGELANLGFADPGSARPIALSQPATGADGLLWDRAGRLIVVSNSTSSALAYVSTDGWESATLDATARFEGQATTGAAVDDGVFVVQPHFNDAELPVILRAFR